MENRPVVPSIRQTNQLLWVREGEGCVGTTEGQRAKDRLNRLQMIQQDFLFDEASVGDLDQQKHTETMTCPNNKPKNQ